MNILVAGGAGIGLVWGWLSGLLSAGPSKRPWINRGLLPAAATAVLGAEVAWLACKPAFLAFLACALASRTLHFSLRLLLLWMPTRRSGPA